MKKKTITILAMSFVTLSTYAQTTMEHKDSVNSVNLPDVMVKGRNVKHSHDGETYAVTDRMRERAANSIEMVGQLPGVRYDQLSGKVSVRMDNNVLLTVDGIEQTKDYVASIPVEKIKNIKVVSIPSQRHRAQGYRYVIDIRTNRSYTGYDFGLANTTMLDAGGNNGSHFVANEQPTATIAGTSRKFSFDIKYGYAAIRLQYPLGYEKSYAGVMDISSKPNESREYYSYHTNVVSGGATWRMNDNHNLTLRFMCNNEHTRTTDENSLSVTKNGAPSPQLFREARTASDIMPNGTLSLFYQGKVGKMELYGDLSYNNQLTKTRNNYTIDTGFSDESLLRNSKDYLRGTFDMKYQISKSTSLKFSYFELWRQYTSRTHDDRRMLSRIRENRRNAGLELQWQPRNELSLSAGLAVEHSHRADEGRNYIKVLPQMQLYYTPTEGCVLSLDYSVTTHYPKQYQLSGASYRLDSVMTFVPNPSLKQTLAHNIMLQGMLWETIQLGAQYTITQNDITPIYTKDNALYSQSLVNARMNSLDLVASCDLPITENISWENTMQYSYMHRAKGNLSNHAHNWRYSSGISYTDGEKGLSTTLEYTRDLYREPLLQGFQEYSQDYWQLTFMKKFFKKCLVASINYILPLTAGIRRYQKSLVESSFHRESTALSTKTYDNFVMLRLRYNLHIGKKVKKATQKSVFEDENKRNRDLL